MSTGRRSSGRNNIQDARSNNHYQQNQQREDSRPPGEGWRQNNIPEEPAIGRGGVTDDAGEFRTYNGNDRGDDWANSFGRQGDGPPPNAPRVWDPSAYAQLHTEVKITDGRNIAATMLLYCGFGPTLVGTVMHLHLQNETT
jgi:hypothetical protein